jgi:hypothetical protein
VLKLGAMEAVSRLAYMPGSPHSRYIIEPLSGSNGFCPRGLAWTLTKKSNCSLEPLIALLPFSSRLIAGKKFGLRVTGTEDKDRRQGAGSKLRCQNENLY